MDFFHRCVVEWVYGCFCAKSGPLQRLPLDLAPRLVLLSTDPIIRPGPAPRPSRWLLPLLGRCEAEARGPGANQTLQDVLLPACAPRRAERREGSSRPGVNRPVHRLNLRRRPCRHRRPDPLPLPLSFPAAPTPPLRLALLSPSRRPTSSVKRREHASPLTLCTPRLTARPGEVNHRFDNFSR